jgi:putative endonuclease
MTQTFYAVYITTNVGNRVLYTGVTNNLVRRIAEHREMKIPGFTSRYRVHKLVYYEFFEQPDLAIAREKQIKAGSRSKKEALIHSMNPEWKDLYDYITDANNSEIASKESLRFAP